MAQDISDTTNLEKPVNVIFQETLLRNAEARAPYFVGTTPGVLQQNGGSATIKWRRINTSLDDASGPAPSTTPLAELTGTASYMQGRDSIVAHITDITATVAKYGQFYILSEEADVFNFNGQTDKLVATLGTLAGRSLNQLQRNVVEDNATQVFGGGAASEGAVATAVATGDLKNVVNQLNRSSAIPFTPMTTGSQNIGTSPILPSYWAICHPDVAEDVADLTGFVSVEAYAGQTAIENFEFGTYKRAGQAIRFLQTEDASINTGAGAAGAASAGLRGATSVDTYTISIYGEDALASVGFGQQQTTESMMTDESMPTVELIVKPMGSGGTSDPFSEIMTMAYKAWWAGAVLNSNWCRALVVGATKLD